MFAFTENISRAGYAETVYGPNAENWELSTVMVAYIQFFVDTNKL